MVKDVSVVKGMRAVAAMGRTWDMMNKVPVLALYRGVIYVGYTVEDNRVLEGGGEVNKSKWRKESRNDILRI